MNTALFSGTGPLVLFIAKATLVLIAALGATFLLRRGTAGERHLVWLAALVGVLALPLVSRIPALRIGILPSQLAPVTATLDGPPTVIVVNTPEDVNVPAVIATTPTVITSTTIQITPSTVAVAAPRAVSIIGSDAAPAIAGASWPTVSGSILQTVAIVWAAIALSLMAWLAFGALQVRRIIATATDLTSPDWTMPLCEVADRLDLEQPPRLVVSDRIEMAFACRALAPTIVLPAACANWNDDRRRAVLFHELAHVKRHDLVSHILGRIACALYWFHPLVWAAARNLRNESEKACDDLVLSCGARASDYAQHLLDMVTSVRNHGAPALGIPMARKKEFEGRMLAILDPAIRRASRGRMHAATVIAGLSAVSLTIAAMAPARVSAAELPDEGTTIARADSAAATATATATATAEASAPAALPSSVETSTATGALLGRAVGTFANTAAKQVLAGLGLSVNQLRATAADTGRVGLLIKVLETDPDAGVRRAAAWGLQDIETAGARTALTHALASDNDSEVREMAAWSLGEHSGSDAASALSNALMHDKSVKVRQTAAWALGQAGRRADADALVSGLADSDAQVRETSIWALGQIDLSHAPATLLNALSDNSAQVREIAAWSLGQIGDTAAVRPLTHAFENETDNKLKQMYLWSLSQIGTAPTELIESAMKSSDPELRRHAVALLTGSGSGAWPMPMPRPMPRPNP